MLVICITTSVSDPNSHSQCQYATFFTLFCHLLSHSHPPLPLNFIFGISCLSSTSTSPKLLSGSCFSPSSSHGHSLSRSHHASNRRIPGAASGSGYWFTITTPVHLIHREVTISDVDFQFPVNLMWLTWLSCTLLMTSVGCVVCLRRERNQRDWERKI
jgi:hypothetical protein